jgi:hypothetical protein
VEFCYNTSFRASLKTSSFCVIYGRDRPTLRAYTPGEARLSTVNNQMMEHDDFLVEIQDRFLQAQQQYKMFYDHHHHKVNFEVGKWMWLRLLRHPITSLNCDVLPLSKDD